MKQGTHAISISGGVAELRDLVLELKVEEVKKVAKKIFQSGGARANNLKNIDIDMPKDQSSRD